MFLTSRFDNVVVMIEELKDLVMMSNEELQSSLEAHEHRIEEMNVDKAKVEISLQVRFNERDKKANGKWHVNKGSLNFHILVEEKPEIPKIQHSKRVKIVAIELVDHTILEVETLEEDEEVRKETKLVCSALVFKSLVTLQESAVPTRKTSRR